MIAVVILQKRAAAQTNHDPETLVIGRFGLQDRVTYRYFQVLQQRGRLIYPDVWWIDFGEIKQYREIGVGGGAVVYNSPRFNVTEEGYFIRATGTSAAAATYLMPWSYVGYHLTPRLGGETSYFPYLPINKAGRIQHILERAKLEYDFKWVKLGGGYAAYRYGNDSWQNKPFVTTTLKGSHLGNLELWLQRMPINQVQLQVRYSKTLP